MRKKENKKEEQVKKAQNILKTMGILSIVALLLGTTVGYIKVVTYCVQNIHNNDIKIVMVLLASTYILTIIVKVAINLNNKIQDLPD